MLNSKVETAMVALFVVFVLSFVTFLGTIWYPYNPADINSITTDKKIYAPGEEICYSVAGDKHYDIPARVTVELANAENIPMANYMSNAKVGKSTRQKRCLRLPYNVHSGEYQIAWTAQFKINEFRTVVRSQRSNYFHLRVGHD